MPRPMRGRRHVVEDHDPPGVAFEITDALGLGEFFQTALDRSKLTSFLVMTGTGLLGLLVMVILAGTITEHGAPPHWKWIVITVVAAEPIVIFSSQVAKLWSLWPLTRHYRLRADHERLTWTEESRYGTSDQHDIPTDRISSLQPSPVDDDALSEGLAPDAHHALTIITDDTIHTFADGLTESDARQLADDLRTALFDHPTPAG